MGNRVSAWILRLPIEEESPAGWVARIKEKTRELKHSKQALGVEMMMQAAEYAPAGLLALGARVASGPINMICTNVPGPQIPLYTLGAKLHEMQPLVPLLDGTGLGIALFSYDGKLHIGLNADYEIVPDLGTFTALFAAQLGADAFSVLVVFVSVFDLVLAGDAVERTLVLPDVLGCSGHRRNPCSFNVLVLDHLQPWCQFRRKALSFYEQYAYAYSIGEGYCKRWWNPLTLGRKITN